MGGEWRKGFLLHTCMNDKEPSFPCGRKGRKRGSGYPGERGNLQFRAKRRVTILGRGGSLVLLLRIYGVSAGGGVKKRNEHRGQGEFYRKERKKVLNLSE